MRWQGRIQQHPEAMLGEERQEGASESGSREKTRCDGETPCLCRGGLLSGKEQRQRADLGQCSEQSASKTSMDQDAPERHLRPGNPQPEHLTWVQVVGLNQFLGLLTQIL